MGQTTMMAGTEIAVRTEVGVLSLSDIQTDPTTGRPFETARRIREIIGYGVLADELGLDFFGLGEHHSLDFAVSSPAVVLAAIAQATRSIRLGSSTSVLSVLDPVRVYQDYATLDLISAGRAEVTVGRSAFLEPFGLFGVDLNRNDEIFAENLELLLRLRADDRVTWRGAFRAPLRDAQIAPRAFVDELPVWVAVGGTPSSAVRTGTLGLPMAMAMIFGSPEQARRTVDLYRAAGQRAGQPAERLRIGTVSHLYVAPTSQGARAELYPHYREYLRPKVPGGRGLVVDPATFEYVGGPDGALMVGSPAEVAEKLAARRELLGIDRVIGQIDLGGLPEASVRRSLELFATEVAPVLRAESAAVPSTQS